MSMLQIEQWPVDRLMPYAKNPRKNDAAVPKMVESLQEFGFRIPVLAKSSGEIIDGHLRYKAAQALGLSEIPVILADDLTDAQVRAFRIMVNRSATWADWDESLLIEELKALELSELDIRFAGFDPEELERLLPPEISIPESETDKSDEELPEPPANPVTQTGDIWLLGNHTLLCGNSADASAISLLMDGASAKFCFTSPPYGQQRDYEGKIGDWTTLMQEVFAILPLENDAQLLVNLGLIRRDRNVFRYWDAWLEWMEARGWNFYDWYVWDQMSGLPGHFRGHLLPSHEWIFHFNREVKCCNKVTECVHAGEVRTGTGMRKTNGIVEPFSKDRLVIQDMRVPDSVIRIRRQVGRIGKDIDHPAVFPVALPEFMQSIWTQKGDIVFEPFSGSGTSIIAAQKSGRICRAVEIAPAYVDVTLIRFSRFFPDIPITLKATGETFAEISAKRRRNEQD